MQEHGMSRYRHINSRDEWIEAISPHFVGARIAERRSRLSLNVRIEPLVRTTVFDVDMRCSGLETGQYGMSAESAARHRYLALLQVSGTSKVEQGGRVVTLMPGDWGLFEGHLPVSFSVRDGSRMVNLLLAANELGRWADLIGSSGRLISRSEDGNMAATLLMELLSRSTEPRDSLKSLVETLLLDLLTEAMERPLVPSKSNCAAAADSAKLRRAKSFISDELTNSALRPDDIGRAIGMSRRALFDLFGQLGQTPMGYVRAQRLNEAARRLRGAESENRSVARIAHDLGFADASHFSRLFRSQYGMSPRQWAVSTNE
jgi:AraC-like DNA-binding protein